MLDKLRLFTKKLRIAIQDIREFASILYEALQEVMKDTIIYLKGLEYRLAASYAASHSRVA